MDYSQIEKIFDDIISQYNEEASQYTMCCPEELLEPFRHLRDAQVNALKSLKALFVNKELYK